MTEMGWEVDEEVNQDKNGEADGIVILSPSFTIFDRTWQPAQSFNLINVGCHRLVKRSIEVIRSQWTILWRVNITTKLVVSKKCLQFQNVNEVMRGNTCHAVADRQTDRYRTPARYRAPSPTSKYYLSRPLRGVAGNKHAFNYC